MRQSYYIILWMRKLKHRVIKSLGLQVYISDPQSWVSVPGCLLRYLPCFSSLCTLLFEVRPPTSLMHDPSITELRLLTNMAKPGLRVTNHSRALRSCVVCSLWKCGFHHWHWSCLSLSTSECLYVFPCPVELPSITACMEAIAEAERKVCLSCIGVRCPWREAANFQSTLWAIRDVSVFSSHSTEAYQCDAEHALVTHPFEGQIIPQKHWITPVFPNVSHITPLATWSCTLFTLDLLFPNKSLIFPWNKFTEGGNVLSERETLCHLP